ncbi:aromatic amino acid aminotransferase [Durotheca rogersii]|uniref:aromatic amino acid aminotransferase n=1 Tax=Durotheca rogersii TaxID=419775 RepID=UPI00221F99BC|nr:aromatic amino acid aminotransferase [Durotheca rogersii]KAI5862770.1 aromatic amino acid aminotransferase [Durotheca rogersii]
MEMSGTNSAADPAKPAPKDMSHHFSDVTKARVPSKMKEFYKFFQIPNIGQLAGGLPNPQLFPFDTLEAQTAKPDRWTPSPNYRSEHDKTDGAPPSRSSAAASHVVVPHDDPTSDPRKKIDLATALQYGQADGYPPLLSFIRQFARDCLHPNVPYQGGPEVVFSVGATDGMAKVLEVFTNVWVEGKHDPRDRPGLLSEVFMYTNVLAQAQPRGVQVVPVEMDAEGMAPHGPGSLEDVLANWDDSKGKRPHLLYTVTMGHNPTGGVLSLERRREIYAICSKYDVVIVEDDPYWYLQFPSAEVEEAKARNLPVPEPKPANTLEKKSGYAYLDSLVPSFLNIDVDGRVVRLDTFSKTVAPGCRMGWLTGAPDVIERVLRVSEASTQQPSGFAQVVIAQTIMGPQPEAAARTFALLPFGSRSTFSGWQMDGWVRWLAGLRGQYERRMVRMCRALEEGAYQLKQSTPLRKADADWGVITKTRLYDFRWPRGGMFVWVRLRFETHPLWQAAGSKGGAVDGTTLATALMIFLTRRPFLVLVSPGLMFSATPEIRARRGWAYFRLCFAAESEENVGACSRRFGDGVQRFWRIKSVHDLEAILEEAKGLHHADVTGAAGMGNLGTWRGC